MNTIVACKTQKQDRKGKRGVNKHTNRKAVDLVKLRAPFIISGITPKHTNRRVIKWLKRKNTKQIETINYISAEMRRDKTTFIDNQICIIQ
jgi:hypothetical protein